MKSMRKGIPCGDSTEAISCEVRDLTYTLAQVCVMHCRYCESAREERALWSQ